MSCNGPGQCCGGDPNIFAFFTHTFWRHVPLTLDSGLPAWWIPELMYVQAESCQDGYLKYVWETSYDNAGVGTRVRTKTHEYDPFVGGSEVESNSGDTTDYPTNEDKTTYDDWVGDGDWAGDNPEYISSSGSYLEVKHYMMNRFNYSHKLVITTKITLSNATTYAGFLNRCEDLYEGVSFAQMRLDAAAIDPGASGWAGLTYQWGPGPVIYATEGHASGQLDWDAFYQVNEYWFAAGKSIRVPDTTIGGATINPRIANPINSGGTYSLSTTSYPLACDAYWPAGQTPTETCAALTLGAEIEVGANPYSYVFIQSGACPP